MTAAQQLLREMMHRTCHLRRQDPIMSACSTNRKEVIRCRVISFTRAWPQRIALSGSSLPDRAHDARPVIPGITAEGRATDETRKAAGFDKKRRPFPLADSRYSVIARLSMLPGYVEERRVQLGAARRFVVVLDRFASGEAQSPSTALAPASLSMKPTVKISMPSFFISSQRCSAYAPDSPAWPPVVSPPLRHAGKGGVELAVGHQDRVFGDLLRIVGKRRSTQPAARRTISATACTSSTGCRYGLPSSRSP